MADFDRGIKAGVAAAAVYLIISVIPSAIYQNNPFSIPYFINATGLTPLFLLRDLTDPSFVIPVLFQYLVRGIIFGAVFAALYNYLPGVTSIVKGVVLSAFLWIVGAVWLIYMTPGWPTDGGATLIVVGLMVSLSSISLALVSIVSALVFGALTGFLWDRFRAKRLAEARKGSPVLRVSFILGGVYWVVVAVAFFIVVVIGGAPGLSSDSSWLDKLSALVVLMGPFGWVLALAAWRKTKRGESGFKWGVAGGVIMALTGIMLFPGALAITGGVLSRRKPASESSTAAIDQ